MAIKNTEKVADNVSILVLDVENGGVRIFHTDSPTLHLRDRIKNRVVAAGRRGLLHDGLRESLTHFDKGEA